MIEIVHVTDVKVIAPTSLRIRFSNGTSGVRDFADIIAEGGPMVEALRDPAVFQRVFVQLGVLTWPNGFDLDAIRLHDEMKLAGSLEQIAPDLRAAE